MSWSFFNRTPHIMKRRKLTTSMGSLLFFDCETRKEIDSENDKVSREVLWFGVAYAFRMEGQKKTREKWCTFHNALEFWDFLKSRLDSKRPLYVFAHNLGFDLTQVGFFKDKMLQTMLVNYAVVEDPPSIISTTIESSKVVFIDTLNYWRQKLADIGDSFGIPKMQTPDRSEPFSKWHPYCRRDVQIIAVAVENLLKMVCTNQWGSIGYTAPTLAMNVFKTRFMKHDIYIHDRKDICQLERAAYYGGRVQCFRLGNVRSNPVYNLDVNSLYPFVMQFSYPTKLLDVIREPRMQTVRELVRHYGCVAEVYLNAKNETYPRRHEDRFCFVKGKFSTFLCGEELKRALTNNDVISVRKIATYKMEYIFTEYVRYFWNLRCQAKKEGNQVANTFAKLMLNSLYGKFGQRGARWVPYDEHSFRQYVKQAEKVDGFEVEEVKMLWELDKPRDKWYVEGLKQMVDLRKINNQIQIRFPVLEHHESFPAIAAFVTSYAREYLLDLMKDAGMQNVFYCDTDSIFCNGDGYKRLTALGHISNSELGKLKVVTKCRSLMIHGLKDYVFGEKIVRKGIRDNAIEISPGVFEQDQFEGLKSVIKRGGDPFITIKRITKENKRKYTKGTARTSGLVSSFTLNLPPWVY